MDTAARGLDGSITRGMRTVTAADLEPTVRIANWIEVPRGMRFGPRWEHDPELCLVVAGRFRYRVAGAEWQEVPERSVLFIPAGEHHELLPDHTAGRCALSCWHGELVAEGSWGDGDYRPAVSPHTVTATDSSPFLLAAFHRLAELWQGYRPDRAIAVRDLVRLIWLDLFAAWSPAVTAAPPRQVAEMLAWLREHLDRPIGRIQIAQHFGVTPQHVNTLFRHGFGMTPGEVVRRERILRAWHDLHAKGGTVAEVAARWGFADPFHFSRVFRRVMGFPPSQARTIREPGTRRR